MVDPPHAPVGQRVSVPSEAEVHGAILTLRRRRHWCTGCSSGACRLSPPVSAQHDSSGSTVTISGGTWTDGASDNWSDGSDPLFDPNYNPEQVVDLS